MRIIENMVIARRRRNERDKSQIIHLKCEAGFRNGLVSCEHLFNANENLIEKVTYLSLTAKRSMRITAIQMKAVRNKRRSIVVRGKTRA